MNEWLWVVFLKENRERNISLFFGWPQDWQDLAVNGDLWLGIICFVFAFNWGMLGKLTVNEKKNSN